MSKRTYERPAILDAASFQRRGVLTGCTIKAAQGPCVSTAGTNTSVCQNFGPSAPRQQACQDNAVGSA